MLDRTGVVKVLSAVFCLAVWVGLFGIIHARSVVFAQSFSQTFTPTGTVPHIVSPTTTAVKVIPDGQTTPVPGTFLSPTATLVPFPTFTLLFPTTTKHVQLLSANREANRALQKANESLWSQFFASVWPFVLIMVIWLFLVLWFIIVQWRS